MQKSKMIIQFIVLAIVLSSCSVTNNEPPVELIQKEINYASFEKAIDDDLQSRKINDSVVDGLPAVKIGNQIWTAYNLNVGNFRNGDEIQKTQFTGEDGIPAWTLLTTDKSDGKRFGKMYNLSAVLDARGLAPKGWHIPTREEWLALETYLGNDAQLKTKSKVGWISEVGISDNGSNDARMSIYPGGCKIGPGAESKAFEQTGFWTSTAVNEEYQYVTLILRKWGLNPSAMNNKGAYYVRLVHD